MMSEWARDVARCANAGSPESPGRLRGSSLWCGLGFLGCRGNNSKRHLRRRRTLATSRRITSKGGREGEGTGSSHADAGFLWEWQGTRQSGSCRGQDLRAQSSPPEKAYRCFLRGMISPADLGCGTCRFGECHDTLKGSWRELA